MDDEEEQHLRSLEELCSELEKKASQPQPPPKVFPPLRHPREVLRDLDEMVAGQERAKRALVVAAYQHTLNVRMAWTGMSRPLFGRQCVLLIGPTGCGKSHLVKRLADALMVASVQISLPGHAGTGYVGRSLEASLSAISSAPEGIAFLDEIDKTKRQSVGICRDITGEMLQEELLVTLERERGPLFVLAGAFSGIEELVSKRCRRSAVGFHQAAQEESVLDVQPEDLIAYGMMPELIGRIRTIVQLEPLTEAAMVEAVSKRGGAVAQATSLLATHGVELTFAPAALHDLAARARKKQLGVRGLESLVNEVVAELVLRLLSESKRVTTVHVTLECVRDGLAPVLEYHERSRKNPHFRLVQRLAGLQQNRMSF